MVHFAHALDFDWIQAFFALAKALDASELTKAGASSFQMVSTEFFAQLHSEFGLAHRLSGSELGSRNTNWDGKIGILLAVTEEGVCAVHPTKNAGVP